MSKVEQGEPQQPECECLLIWGSHHPECPTGLGKVPESQPAPEMDYQQEALSLQDAIDNIVPCTDQEVAAIAAWLRAHDARVQPSSVAGTESSLVREAYIILEGLRLGVTWEIAPPIMDEIVKWCARAESALKESSHGK